MLQDVQTIQAWFKGNYPDGQVPDATYTIPIRGKDYLVCVIGGVIQGIMAKD